MPNDDLGTFPMPPKQTSDTPVEPVGDIVSPSTPTAPLAPTPVYPAPQLAPTPTPTPTFEPIPSAPPIPAPENTPTFEPTPDEIPSFQTPPLSPIEPISSPEPVSSPHLMAEQDKLVSANEAIIEKQIQPEPEPISPPMAPPIITAKPEELPASATYVKKGFSVSPVIIVVLVIIAGIGLAAATFLYQQSGKLKTQLEEITQTLDKQKTIVTPTPSPTTFEIPTPTITPTPETGSPSATITPIVSPTISETNNNLLPLSLTPKALKIAINRSPNAQLILIKVDNATSPLTSVTKYFFREDLTTKKYFYVAITGKGEPEIIDKQIYVTPDDNIPSLNDSILSNTLGIDLDEAMSLTYAQCTNLKCSSYPAKAQYIKTGTGIIWQISLYPNGFTGTSIIAQINANTKAVLYKSPDFAK